MINNNFKEQLKTLRGKKIEKTEQEGESSGVWVIVEGDVKVFTAYWRLLNIARDRLSSFDHNSNYGLSDSIDAVKELNKKIMGLTIDEFKFIEESGDCEFVFTTGDRLQIFNFTSCEVWEIVLSGDDGELSNYN